MGTTKQLSRRLAKGVFPEASKWYFDELFNASEVGVLYDPSDLSTLFQDSAGTTPVTAPGQPVGLVLDKSKGLVLGSELVTNGTFNTDTTGWSSEFASLSVVSQALRVTNSGNAIGRAFQGIATVIGRWYQVTVTLVGGTSTGRARIGTTNFGDQNFSQTIAVGTTTFCFLATATTSFLQLRSDTATTGAYTDWDNISVRELPGNHASQSTAASRPIYGVIPKIFRKNLLINTDLIAGAVSGTPGTIPTSWASFDTTGTITVASDGLRITTSSGRRYMSQNFSVSPNTSYSFSCICDVHAAISLNNALALLNSPAGATIQYYQDGALVSNSNNQLQLLNNTEVKIVLTTAATGASTTFRIGNGTSIDSTGDITYKRVQLEVGSVRTSYETIGTPYSPRRNLLLQSKNLSISPWGHSTSNAISRSLSGMVNNEPATLITAIADTDAVYQVSQSIGTIAANQRYTLRVQVKDVSNGFAMIGFGTIGSWSVRTQINLSNGVLASTSNAQDIWRTAGWYSTPNSDGSYEVGAIVWATSDATANLLVNLQTSGTTLNSLPTIGNAILVSAPQIEIGEIKTPYQRTGTVHDITEQGAPTCHYLQFDGVDDWLSTAAIDFSGTDKMSVFAGVRKLSDAAQGTLVELTNNSTNAGAFSLLVGNNTATRRVALSIASPQDLIGTEDQAEVVSFVTDAVLDRSGANAASSIFPAINGFAPTSSEVIDGNATGNFANSQLFIGRRGGTSNPFNGQLFGLIIRGANSTTAERRQSRKLLARRTSEVTLL